MADFKNLKCALVYMLKFYAAQQASRKDITCARITTVQNPSSEWQFQKNINKLSYVYKFVTFHYIDGEIYRNRYRYICLCP